MKLLKTLKELSGYNEAAFHFLKPGLDAAGVTTDEPLDTQIGGNIYVIESYADLKDIPAMGTNEAEGRRYNITEVVEKYDAFYIIPESGWYACFLATNDAGGNLYMLPIDMVDNDNHLTAVKEFNHYAD